MHPRTSPQLQTWLAACHTRLNTPAHLSRIALRMGNEEVGSVHPDLWPHLTPHWPAQGDTSKALAQAAKHLHAIGLAGAWRDELMPVRDAFGRELAAVERALVRVLGVRTEAVHLVGFAPDGRVWLQQRAFDKPNDPGLWDTLVGGLVAHGETLAETLQRETWEEAGLRLRDLVDLQAGGAFNVSKPSADGGGLGHMAETIHWFTAMLPAGLSPVNQDGEVARFEAFEPDAVGARVIADQCTDEAAWVLALALGWPLPVSGL